ncbi:hypothetical protein [Sphingopyxis macrogoltabida]|uniref:Uncharacterized protein n=1 Tax=Sphingopyxis macrogoltabida TaxID=33050 RepID=A0AAC9AZU2_SPHMC|nr:hypothetical protein [Sphingopyxis macrogoltabida]ALJ16593.1 hypothetical protein LH19_27715 [Sphingopyxis macrogoltabida]AMU92822.1 hypothetical protein ATM17_31690 [Sphingopyxis macrogoltabida]
MEIHFRLEGYCQVPDGTRPLDEVRNQFRLPSGAIVSICPVVELATSENADDHRDLSHDEGVELGLVLEILERDCALVEKTGT